MTDWLGRCRARALDKIADACGVSWFTQMVALRVIAAQEA